MKKDFDYTELSTKAFKIAVASDFKLYEENGFYYMNSGDIKDLRFTSVEEMSCYIEAFEE